MKTIWFNHWFSSAYRIIELLKKDLNCKVIGTNDKPDCAYKKVCDSFYVEPVFTDENEYVQWCLGVCEKFNVDIFIPRRSMVEISKHSADFEKVGTKVVVCCNYKNMSLLNDKGAVYKYLKDKSIVPIPDFETVNDVNAFERAYLDLHEKHPDKNITFKYSIGEGATSFRNINDAPKDLSVLDTGKSMALSYNNAVLLLSTEEKFNDLLVMPYLEGPEISIDCINLDNDFYCVCRRKCGSRVTEVFQDAEYEQICRELAKEFNLTGAFNVQFRIDNGIPYLLEINTRMSGGIHISCLTGLNIPTLMVKHALGMDIPKQEYKKDTFKVTQIETPIIL